MLEYENLASCPFVSHASSKECQATEDSFLQIPGWIQPGFLLVKGGVPSDHKKMLYGASQGLHGQKLHTTGTAVRTVIR